MGFRRGRSRPRPLLTGPHYQNFWAALPHHIKFTENICNIGLEDDVEFMFIMNIVLSVSRF